MIDLGRGEGAHSNEGAVKIIRENKLLLSSVIRNSLTKLDMLVYLGKNEEAQDEIQALSAYLDSQGI